MEIYKYAPGVALDTPAVIALGYFDGVHAGHRRLLDTARSVARDRGLDFAVFTFTAEGGLKGTSPIYTTEQKLALLEEAGADRVIIADFSDISSVSAEDFIKNCLVCDMNCRVAVCGQDYRFGQGALGDTNFLSSILSELSRECIIEDEHRIYGEKISSTKIKELLSLGEVDLAREFLGMPYHIRCEVVRGLGVGRTLGFPTVNTALSDDKTLLPRGVYRTAVDIDGVLYTGVTNVGVCPTFDERALHAETYIVGYQDDLYGKKIRIFFLGYLREEKKFSSPEELIMQINVDKNEAIYKNGELKWQEIGPNLP